MKGHPSAWRWITNHHRIVLCVVAALMLILITIVFEYAFQSVMKIFTEITYNHNQQIRKDFIQNTVDNLICDVDVSRQQIQINHPEWTAEQIRDGVKNYLKRRIYDAKYKDGAYLWVHEIHDFLGGDKYATRLIHPKLPDSEGSYLTTDYRDADGGYPYLMELEGIKAHGYIFHEYSFQADSDSPAERRLAYARLYPEYNWIISMGIRSDTLNSYPEEIRKSMSPLLQRLIFSVFTVTALIFLWGFVFVRITSKNEFRKERDKLKLKANWDTLTSAHSRAYGIDILKREYDASREFGEMKKTAVMLLDVDNFKTFNDMYGHELGDKVLYNIVKAVRSASRSTDAIIRWGGDEFVGVYQGISPHNLATLMEKILSAVRNLQVEYQGKQISVTVSIGFTFFSESDDSYKDTLERADKALYITKRNGRNGGHILPAEHISE